MKRYEVYVDDNYHMGDESKRYKLGEFDTREQAVAACKKVVDEYFERLKKGEYPLSEIWDGYMYYGEDPFISNDDDGEKFSAWEYAKEKCGEYARVD